MATSIDVAVGAIRGADPARFADPSPCPDWTVGQAVNHLAFGLLLADRGARKQAWDAEWAGDDRCPFLRDVPEDEWAARAAEQAETTAAAWADAQAWEGETPFGGAQMPASAVGSLMTAEFVVHAWDVAVATGQHLAVPTPVAEAALAAVQSIAAMGREGGWFGPEVPVSADASPFDRALGASGRDPRWSPS